WNSRAIGYSGTAGGCDGTGTGGTSFIRHLQRSSVDRGRAHEPRAFGWHAHGRSSGVDVAAALDRAPEGDLVGVFEIAAHRHAARDTCHARAETLERARDEHRGRVAFDVGVRRQHHLDNAFVLDTTHEFLDAQLVGTDALDRRDRALQHVITTTELMRAFDGDDVTRILHDTEDACVAPIVETDGAQLADADVEALPAPRDAFLRFGDRAREPARVLGCRLQQVERDALRGLRADAR